MGVCPQHDILFDELTVREHLLFFSRLKARGLAGAAAPACAPRLTRPRLLAQEVPEDRIESSINESLHEVQLEGQEGQAAGTCVATTRVRAVRRIDADSRPA
jgi:hypothetical protein